MSCSNCGSEYCDGEKCDENGGQDPFPDPTIDDDGVEGGDDTDEDLEEDEDLDGDEDDEDLDDDEE